MGNGPGPKENREQLLDARGWPCDRLAAAREGGDRREEGAERKEVAVVAAAIDYLSE